MAIFKKIYLKLTIIKFMLILYNFTIKNNPLYYFTLNNSKLNII